MITEAITIGAILGASAAVVWLTKAKFQPEIERNLSAMEEAIPARNTKQRTH
ncbi:MAG TPA: hypothetical protein VJL54_09560 [Nitrososphaera sp.]|jgi:hypothetical protein|nr:hypothetical protein [Nitrososphaera sp.]HKX82488.1 hypothetical protein [Nitrososphaera sp.]